MKDCIRLALFVLTVIGIICFNEGSVAAQTSPSSRPTREMSKPNTVSVKQLLSPGSALRRAYRARRYLIAGQLDKAQEEVKWALVEAPHCAAALDIQAAIHVRTGQIDDAAKEFQEAIDSDPALGQAYLGLGMLLISRDQFKDALVPLDRARSLLPTSWRVYFETAIAELGLGDMEATLKQIRYAEALADQDLEKRSGTAYLRALVFMNLRDYESATMYMNEAIRFNPSGSYAKPALAKIDQMKHLLSADKSSRDDQ